MRNSNCCPQKHAEGELQQQWGVVCEQGLACTVVSVLLCPAEYLVEGPLVAADSCTANLPKQEHISLSVRCSTAAAACNKPVMTQ